MAFNQQNYISGNYTDPQVFFLLCKFLIPALAHCALRRARCSVFTQSPHAFCTQAILAEEEAVPCTFTMTATGLGFLDPGMLSTPC